jgi:hypothetical protein
MNDDALCLTTAWKVYPRPSQGISQPKVHIMNRDRETLRNHLFHYYNSAGLPFANMAGGNRRSVHNHIPRISVLQSNARSIPVLYAPIIALPVHRYLLIGSCRSIAPPDSCLTPNLFLWFMLNCNSLRHTKKFIASKLQQ